MLDHVLGVNYLWVHAVRDAIGDPALIVVAALLRPLNWAAAWFVWASVEADRRSAWAAELCVTPISSRLLWTRKVLGLGGALFAAAFIPLAVIPPCTGWGPFAVSNSLGERVFTSLMLAVVDAGVLALLLPSLGIALFAAVPGSQRRASGILIPVLVLGAVDRLTLILIVELGVLAIRWPETELIRSFLRTSRLAFFVIPAPVTLLLGLWSAPRYKRLLTAE